MLQRGNLIVQIENLECSGYWAVGEDEKGREGTWDPREITVRSCSFPIHDQAHAFSGARLGKRGAASGFLFPG
jgi:hypothetical protein